MKTWEDRMAARGPRILDRETARRAAEERAAKDRAEAFERRPADDYRSWYGTCDVCGQPITLTHSYTVDGVIDVGVGEGGDVFTWIRHAAGPLPDCRVYMSRVYQVPQ